MTAESCFAEDHSCIQRIESIERITEYPFPDVEIYRKPSDHI